MAAELAGGSIAYSHSFSDAQMRALEVVVDTFLPSIPPPDDVGEEALQQFYHLSASEAGVPSYIAYTRSLANMLACHHLKNPITSDDYVYEQAAGLMHSKLRPDLLKVARVVLWLLSTRIGTYLLFGHGSVCSKPPFLRSFDEIPLLQREKLLLSAWSQSPYLFFRTIFNAFKIFIVYSFFTKVDEHGFNPSWKAIGYWGPDPAAVEHRRNAERAARKPLEGRVFDASMSKEGLSLQLEEAGFQVFKDVAHISGLWKQGSLDAQKSKTAMGVKCDVVVVGSGSGGGVAAGVLAKAGYKVLIIEKGKYFARDDLSLLEGPSMDKMYEGGGVLATDNANVLLLAGATVGGGSAVNWSASFKTPTHVLEEWSQDKGLTMFGKTGEYEAAMEAVLDRLSVQPDPGEENWQNKLLRKGCEKLGFHVAHASRNAVANHSCGWCTYGCWSGKKQATSETWLVDAVSNGAVVLTGISAEAVLHRNATDGKKGQSVGVVGSTGNGKEVLFIESRITMVACGSLNTPVLLQRSGLKNPHIGKHLHLHPVQMMWGYFPPDGISDDVAYDGAIITSLSQEVANWHRGGHGCILQCPCSHPGVSSVLTPWVGALDYKERMHRFSRTVHVFALARDRGSGTIGDSKHGRTVYYPLDPLDHQSLVDGGEAALRVLIAAGASEVGTHHRFGDRLAITQDTSPDAVEEFLQRVRSRGIEQLGTPLCSAHQMGSCRMGTDPCSSAVDPNGETWDVAGLFVADASVFPSAIGINPMITTQSIAYCVANAASRALEQR